MFANHARDQKEGNKNKPVKLRLKCSLENRLEGAQWPHSGPGLLIFQCSPGQFQPEEKRERKENLVLKANWKKEENSSRATDWVRMQTAALLHVVSIDKKNELSQTATAHQPLEGTVLIIWRYSIIWDVTKNVGVTQRMRQKELAASRPFFRLTIWGVSGSGLKGSMSGYHGSLTMNANTCTCVCMCDPCIHVCALNAHLWVPNECVCAHYPCVCACVPNACVWAQCVCVGLS